MYNRYSEALDREAAVKCLTLLGLSHPDEIEKTGKKTYRHTARNGTIRILTVYGRDEYFARAVNPDERLHKVLMRYIVEERMKNKEEGGRPCGAKQCEGQKG